METLRVCLLTADFQPMAHGGLARYSSGLHKGLVDIGLEVTMIVPSHARTGNEDPSIVGVFLPFHGNRALRYPLFNLVSLARQAEKDYDIIHGLSTQQEVGLSRLITPNLVLTVHNTFAQQIETPYGSSRIGKALRLGFYSVMRLWEAIAFRAARQIIAVSRGTKESLIRSYSVDPTAIEVIYSGVDFERFQAKRNLPPSHGLDPGYLLFVGRVVPRKGLEYAIDALSKANEDVDQLTLLIVGASNPAYEAALLRHAEQRGVSERIAFVGQVSDDDLVAFYQHASALILPSLVEGFGLVCHEAMASGTPVVASDIPGTREAVMDGVTGLLVPPTDSLGLSRAIVRLLNDEGLRRRLGRAGREHVKQYTWEQCARMVYQCYKRIV